MTTRATYMRCVSLDDPYDDDVCPKCGQNIVGWEEWEFHHPGNPSHDQTYNRAIGLTLSPWPFTSTNVNGVCPWTSDYLTARAHRRRLIREGITQ